MAKINLNFNIKSLDGKDVEEGNAGKLIANLLVGGAKGDPIKYYDWAQAFYKKKDVEIDAADCKKLHTFIEEHEGLTVLAKAQILPKFSTK